jgi:hypothetical protein
MMRTLFIVFILSIIFSTRVYAVGGVGDVVNDPQANAQLATTNKQLYAMFSQAQEMYRNAKAQLDGMVAIERTIREASEAYETLSKLDLNKAVQSLQQGGVLNSFANLRGLIANKENSAENTFNRIDGNIQRIRQLENFELIRSASVNNMSQSSEKINANTSAAITAQGVSAMTTLAAIEAQRREKEDIAKDLGEQKEANNTEDMPKIYNALGSHGKTK